VWEPEELIAAGVTAGVQPPGTPGYSTTNYLILQLIAESITGSPLEDLITQDVTEPLGLAGTVLPPPDDTTLPDPHTSGYIAGGGVTEMADDGATVDEGTDTTDWNTSFTQGGGGMYTTIGDLLGWAQSTSGNTLLGDDLAQQRLETAPIGGGIDYGLGIFKIGTNWYGHEGEALGWEALAVTDPDTGVSVAIAMNGAGGQFLYFANFLDTLYPDGNVLATMMAAG
jgi:D-alanyl-D-alanine carboxypeptidase